MRILLMANNWGGWQVCRLLRQQNEDIVGLVIHPPDNQKYTEEILDEAGVPTELIRDASQLRNQQTVEFLRSLKPDIIISAFFAYILKPDVIEIPPRGCINLHPSYLPINRGWHPNVWPILDESPAGVTIHYIEAGIDTGDIIAQKLVDVEPIDTGKTLHRKLTRELIELFKESWPSIKAGTNARMPQDSWIATSHKRKDMDEIDYIDLKQEYVAKDLINILRERTYPPYPSAYFMHNGRRVYVRSATI